MSDINSLSIVLPVYNLEDNIKQTVIGTIAFIKEEKLFEEYEIIAVNDGSDDKSGAILIELTNLYKNIKIVTHSKNLGYGSAMISGIKNAKYPLMLLMDADGQFKIDSIKDFVAYFSDYDIIAGFRYRRQDPLCRILLGKIYTNIANKLFGLRLNDINCGFKILKKEIFNWDSMTCHAGGFYTEIFIRAKEKKCLVKEVPIAHYRRTVGRQTGASIKVIICVVRDMFRLKVKKILKWIPSRNIRNNNEF